MKVDIIRVDDLVVIQNPLEFVRCGYDLTKQDMRARLRAHRGDVYALLRKLGIVANLAYIPRREPRGLKRLEDQLAYMMLHSGGFPANERRIYEQESPRLDVGRQYRVIGVSYFKTGNYSPASPGTYECPNDCDPPELRNQKTHKVLTLNTNSHLLGPLRIRACHVEKIIQQDERRE